MQYYRKLIEENVFKDVFIDIIYFILTLPCFDEPYLK